MSDPLKDFETTPTLVFGTEPEAEEIVKVEPVKEELNEQILSEEEREMVEHFVKQIDLRNSNAILQYGAGTQKKMADFSETALNNVRSKDLGEIGDLLSDVVVELKNFDADEEEDKGFFGFFKKQSNRLANMKAKYDAC